MKLFHLLICIALVAGFTAVNGKTANKNEHETKTTMAGKSPPVVVVTPAVTPTRAPKTTATPAKASMGKGTAKPNNSTKKMAVKMSSTMAAKKVEVKPTEKVPMDPVKLEEVKPMAMPVIVPIEKSVEMEKKEMPMQVEMMPKEVKPLTVTGFITQNGNIYEVENKNGIGKIEGRQNPDEVKEHICNYGSVVVYSDLPCDSVTHVSRDKEEGQQTADQKPAAENQDNMMDTSNNNENMNQNNNVDTENLEELPPVRKTRPNSKKPRRNNKNKWRIQQKKRRFNNRRGVNQPFRQQNQNQRRNQQFNNQQFKRRQQQRRRQQQNLRQQQLQNQRRRGNNRPQYYEEDYDEGYGYGRGFDF